MSLPERISQFVTTVLGGRTTKEVADERLKICVTCPSMFLVAGRKFCRGCACPSWMLSDLDGGPLPKLGWATLQCPQKRW